MDGSKADLLAVNWAVHSAESSVGKWADSTGTTLDAKKVVPTANHKAAQRAAALVEHWAVRLAVKTVEPKAAR